MEMTPAGTIITGYKATDKNMQCRGFQYELGTWYEHDGEIELCDSGFHFCEYPSGPWAYYSEGRLFKCEAELVLTSTGTGADLKHVAKRIRLVEEIEVDGDRNTGDGNTGDGNTGNRNTGNRNTGNRNTGDRNTGDRNTGDGNTGNGNTGDGNTGNRNTGNRNTGNRNTGNRNTGNRNTGNWNTGNGNTGNRNTGDGNTGNRNTGNWNTGNWNTGDGNVGSFHSGSLNREPAPIYLFDKLTDVPRDEIPWHLVCSLAGKLMKDDEIDASLYLGIPNATPEGIKKLHEAHKEVRKADASDFRPSGSERVRQGSEGSTGGGPGQAVRATVIEAGAA